MINIDFNNECCGCSACSQICPYGCISMTENSEGFLIPEIDLGKCVNCSLCEKVCPVLNSETENLSDDNIPKNVYAAYNKNDDIRLKSSSGGIFTILAEYALKRDGVVFGARFSDDSKYVYHCMVENENDISFLRGSKYVQSDINNTYKEVRKQLETGRFVLFSGTPCQVEGLILFLKKKYENLLLVDIICHGVPSPKVWRKYLEYVENKNLLPKTVYFRDKTNGWNSFSFRIDYTNGEKYVESFEKSLYGSAFVSDLFFRKSCYKCRFRKANHKSDLTICDFWGIDEAFPDMNDNKGISAVIVNSVIGKKIFDDIECKMIYKQVNFYTVEKHNMILKQIMVNKNRDRFYKWLNRVDFEKNVKKNIPRRSILIRMPYKIAKVCLKTVLGNKNFDKLKMWLKSI